MNTAPEVIIDDLYDNGNCYVIEAPKANIRAITSDHDLAQHIFDYLSKQYDHSCISEYLDVDVTHFIAAKNTSLANRVGEFVNELQSCRPEN